MALLLKSCVKNSICYSNGVRTLSTLHNGNSMPNKIDEKQTSNLHVSAKVQYPQAEPLPLPNNINDDTAHFSPQRARDLTSVAIMSHQSLNTNVNFSQIDVTAEVDSHTQCYDCNGAVSLNSSMQSNVPSPFSGSGNHYMHLNMPGGQWEQWSKYVSNDLQCSHYTNLRQQIRSNDDKIKGTAFITKSDILWNPIGSQSRSMHTKSRLHKSSDTNILQKQISNDVDKEKNTPISKREYLKRAIKEYGSTVIIFHISHSLLSLGLFYLLISSGLDVAYILSKMGMEQHIEKLAGAGTFVAAYAVNKLLAPIRISFTLACTPFIVKYLRKIGFIKPHNNKSQGNTQSK